LGTKNRNKKLRQKISGAVRETAPDEFVNCALALMADTQLDAKTFLKVVPLITAKQIFI
jgi:hypothetical protein